MVKRFPPHVLPSEILAQLMDPAVRRWPVTRALRRHQKIARSELRTNLPCRLAHQATVSRAWDDDPALPEDEDASAPSWQASRLASSVVATAPDAAAKSAAAAAALPTGRYRQPLRIRAGAALQSQLVQGVTLAAAILALVTYPSSEAASRKASKGAQSCGSRRTGFSAFPCCCAPGVWFSSPVCFLRCNHPPAGAVDGVLMSCFVILLSETWGRVICGSKEVLQRHAEQTRPPAVPLCDRLTRCKPLSAGHKRCPLSPITIRSGPWRLTWLRPVVETALAVTLILDISFIAGSWAVRLPSQWRRPLMKRHGSRSHLPPCTLPAARSGERRVCR